MNSRLNRTYSLGVVLGSPKDLMLMFYCLTGFWDVYGLRHDSDGYEKNRPVVTICARLSVPLALALMTTVSTKLQNGMSSLAWEVDRRVSTKNGSVEARQVLVLVMMEMHHSSMELSILDLFKMDNSSFTSLAGFVISTMTVFVQFMK